MEYKISDAEWKVMRVLWNQSGLTLKEIADQLKDTSWSYTTIRTLINRLLEKGAITADKTSVNAFKYFPAVLESECKESEVKSFLSRVFDGSAAMMMATLINGGGLSKKESEKLKKIIEEMDGDRE
ncbi:MAG: BlaI/MecI/CopY family transcriptional regulator [Clostridiales bacterium]|nr:BlaI/MecI/CopY family transcriptional regulator [Clostridiales bacterium]